MESEFLTEFNGMIHPIAIHTHVKVVKFVSDYLFYGLGNKIHCYNWKRKVCLDTVTSFDSTSTVHGIKILSEKTDKIELLIFGGKSARIYSFCEHSHVRLKAITEEQFLEDWIHDASPYSSSSDDIVAFVTAHNTVVVWDWRKQKKLDQYHCAEKCILYSAHILSSRIESLIVAAGTVFKEIVIWSPNVECSNRRNVMEPFHKLTGHQGVVFSITFNETLGLLCSTSDDRSLRLWKFLPAEPSDDPGHPLKSWTDGVFQFLHTLYAHESRVWSAAISHHCIISVGEDSMVCFWKMDGSLLRQEKCHSGGSIWCTDVTSDNSIAVTGGSDSGILLWNIKQIIDSSTPKLIPMDLLPSERKDFPRNVLLLTLGNDHHLLVCTDHGKVFLHDLSKGKWIFEYADSTFASYCLPSISPDNKVILIGNLLGEIFAFTFNGYILTLSQQTKIFDGKVNSIHWIDDNCQSILACGLNGRMMLLDVQVNATSVSLSQKCLLHLPKNKHHWWSTVAVYIRAVDIIVVGDRGGSIHVYVDVSKNHNCEHKEPDFSYWYIHGKNGVTDMKVNGRSFYSIGRDGKLIAYHVSDDGLSKLHHVKVPYDMEWLAKLCFINNDLVVLGFHSKEFVSWSMKQGRLLTKISCGGGHRSWDFSVAEDYSSVFVAIKKKELFVAREQLKFIFNEPSVQAGVFGMAVQCACHITTLNYDNEGEIPIVAFGSEDTSVKIVNLKDHGTRVAILQHLAHHISNVRGIAKCRIPGEDETFLMISAGGRAQMCAWMLNFHKSDIICRHLSTNFIWNADKFKPLARKPVDDPQTRYMDVAVWYHSKEDYFIASACSDGFVRLHIFSTKTNSFVINTILSHGEYCVLKTSFLGTDIGPEFILATGATDGCLRFYNKAITKTSNADHSDEAILQMSLHQSGINALHMKCLPDGMYLICAGGDDSCITTTLMSNGATSVKATGKRELAHASQITGVHILSAELLLSVSIDQRLNLWRWKNFDGNIRIELLESKITSVADVSNLEVLPNKVSQVWTVIVCGEGFEVFKICALNTFSSIYEPECTKLPLMHSLTCNQTKEIDS